MDIGLGVSRQDHFRNDEIRERTKITIPTKANGGPRDAYVRGRPSNNMTMMMTSNLIILFELCRRLNNFSF